MRALALVSLLALVAGCSAAVDEESPDAESMAQGSLAVERVVSLSPASFSGTSEAASSEAASSERMQTRVSARFVRVSGGIDQAAAEQVVGSALRLSADAALGCGWHDGAADSAPAEVGDGAIELLDVGDIVLRAGSTAMPLAARAFPDVGDLVSGVVYTSRDDATALPSDSLYSIDIAGSSFMDGFSLQAEAPAAPTAVQLDQQPLDASELTVTIGEDMNFSWEPGSASMGDRIFVELALADADAASTLRCVFEDGGAGVVPAALVAFPAAAAVDVAVHRHRRMTVSKQASGIDGALVDFDFGVAARAITTE